MPNNTFEASLSSDLNIRLQPAPSWKRFCAYMVDMAIIMLGFYALFFVLMIFGGILMGSTAVFFSKGGSDTAIGIVAILFFLAAILVILGCMHGYFIYNEYKFGSTLGKRLFGLKVLSAENKRLTLGQCTTREFMRWIDCLFFIPGTISILLTKKHQRLGDLLAGTVVTYQKKEEDKKNFMYIKQDQYNLLMNELRPDSMAKSDCENYLALAFQYFARNNRDNKVIQALQMEAQKFVACMHNYQSDKIDPTLLQLFIAEHCFQQMQNKDFSQHIN